jgi:chromosome partitioning protein
LFLEVVRQVNREVNPQLHILGVLLTFYDERLSHHRAIAQALQAANLPVLPVTIGRSVRVAEAVQAAQPVITFDPKNAQSKRYRALAVHLHQWLQSHV